jgi:hypothetical protein
MGDRFPTVEQICEDVSTLSYGSMKRLWNFESSLSPQDDSGSLKCPPKRWSFTRLLRLIHILQLHMAPCSITQSQNHELTSRNERIRFCEAYVHSAYHSYFHRLRWTVSLVQCTQKLFWYRTPLLKRQISLWWPIETTLTFCVPIVCSVSQRPAVRSQFMERGMLQISRKRWRQQKRCDCKTRFCFSISLDRSLRQNQLKHDDVPHDCAMILKQRMGKWT